jgi:hypothetical protein
LAKLGLFLSSTKAVGSGFKVIISMRQNLCLLTPNRLHGQCITGLVIICFSLHEAQSPGSWSDVMSTKQEIVVLTS